MPGESPAFRRRFRRSAPRHLFLQDGRATGIHPATVTRWRMTAPSSWPDPTPFPRARPPAGADLRNRRLQRVTASEGGQEYRRPSAAGGARNRPSHSREPDSPRAGREAILASGGSGRGCSRTRRLPGVDRTPPGHGRSQRATRLGVDLTDKEALTLSSPGEAGRDAADSATGGHRAHPEAYSGSGSDAGDAAVPWNGEFRLPGRSHSRPCRQKLRSDELLVTSSRHAAAHGARPVRSGAAITWPSALVEYLPLPLPSTPEARAVLLAPCATVSAASWTESSPSPTASTSRRPLPRPALRGARSLSYRTRRSLVGEVALKQRDGEAAPRRVLRPNPPARGACAAAQPAATSCRAPAPSAGPAEPKRFHGSVELDPALGRDAGRIAARYRYLVGGRARSASRWK